MLKHYLDPLGPINPHPTQFPELNELLADLTQQARAILGSIFVGAYLQGSFAVGDADMHSDCDFLIPVSGPISVEQETGLRRLHEEIPTRDGHWSINLEGSYPALAELRSLRGLGAPWLYIDRGHREMIWSTHCNTEVARWSLREQGVVLVGPQPKTLVDEVPAEIMRARARDDVGRFMESLLSWTDLTVAWSQRYAVATYCRMLYTLDSGKVASKKAALHWALGSLDQRWQPLLTQVLEDRARGWDPADQPRNVAATIEFARYSEALAGARANGASIAT